MYPSIKTLQSRLNIDRATARTVRGLIDGSICPSAVEATEGWLRSCYHRPSDLELAMHAIDVTLGNFGVESLSHDGEGFRTPTMVYSNNGDSYDATVIYDYDRDLWLVEGWADWVEKAEHRGLKFQ